MANEDNNDRMVSLPRPPLFAGKQLINPSWKEAGIVPGAGYSKDREQMAT